MTTTIANFTLPAMCHVVCSLVATGLSGIDVTNPVPPTNQTFPEGYVAYSDIGFAYKVYAEEVDWMEARRRCVKEGAQLAVIDSAKKVEYVKRQYRSSDYAKVGIHRMYDDSTWVAVGTGEPVSSLPWLDSYPTKAINQPCVSVYFPKNGLRNYDCTPTANYICELPIIRKTTLPIN